MNETSNELDGPVELTTKDGQWWAWREVTLDGERVQRGAASVIDPESTIEEWWELNQGILNSEFLQRHLDKRRAKEAGNSPS